MGTLITPIRFLNNLEMESVHQAALQILDEVGMWIDSEEALNYLEEYGCNVNYDNLTVRFPPDLVQAAVAHMRRAGREHATLLAELAVEETGMGRVEDKILKNILNYALHS